MKEIKKGNKKNSPKTAVFQNLVTFAQKVIAGKKQAETRTERAEAGTRAMEHFHMYKDERKKIFGRHDQRHAALRPHAVP